jgi:hypothetical protein
MHTTRSSADSLPDHAGDRTTRAAWLVGPAFLLMAVWFLLAAPTAEIPFGGTPTFDPAGLAPTVRKTINQDPPLTTVGVYQYRCNECHEVFENETEKTSGLVQHTNIVFNHGMNNRCFNCHDRMDRNKLVGRDGRYLSYTDIPMLCAQCHGTTYQDWRTGMHGKTLGSWQTGSPEQHRLACDQCHDPHAPAFPRFVPLPGPNTLRMGDQPTEPHHARPSPLALPFLHPSGGDAGHGPGAGPGEAGVETHEDRDGEGGADH